MPLALAVLLASSMSGLPEPTVEVAFAVTPSLCEPGKPPRLVVSVTNVTRQPIPFMRFPSDSCFAHFYLEAKLTGPAGEKEAAPGCAIRDWPGVKGELAAGKTERRELGLGALFPSVAWGKGHYALEVSWESAPLGEAFDKSFAARATQSSLSNGEFTIAPLRASVRIERGKTVALPGGARLRFDGHGHKDVMAGGPSSPLIISGAFAPPGAKTLEEFSVNVHPEESTAFAIGGHAFDLGRYEYGSWMELRYFGAVE